MLGGMKLRAVSLFKMAHNGQQYETPKRTELNTNQISNTMKRFQKMTTGVLYALLCVVLMGCGESLREKYDRWMTELDCPVILISKTDKAVIMPSITVRDGSGRIRTFERCEGSLTDHSCSDFSGSVADSRMVGDTLKPCD